MDAATNSESASLLPTLRSQAQSADPRERIDAAERLRGLLERDFEVVFEGTRDWVLDPSANLREVGCRALTVRGADVDVVVVRRLIGRAELFMGSPDRHVAEIAAREVLPYLLGLHPRLISEWVQTWTTNPDELTRADTAAVLASLAARFPTEAVDGLAAIAPDPRPRVRAGFAAALRDLVRRQPGMAPYLRTRFPNRV